MSAAAFISRGRCNRRGDIRRRPCGGLSIPCCSKGALVTAAFVLTMQMQSLHAHFTIVTSTWAI